MNPFIARSHYRLKRRLEPAEKMQPMFPVPAQAPKDCYEFPMLEFLSISNIYDPRSLPLPFILADKLETLVLYQVYMDSGDYMALAASTPNVKDLSLRKLSWDSLDEDEDPGYYHSKLQTLTFQTSDPRNPHLLLSSFQYLIKRATGLQRLNIYSQSKRNDTEGNLWKETFDLFSTMEAINQAVYTVTILDLHMGDFPSPDSDNSDEPNCGFTQFLSAFTRVETFTLRWDLSYPKKLSPTSKDHLLRVWRFSSSLMSVLPALSSCRHFILRSASITTSHLLYLATQLQGRISITPARLTLDSGCAVWEEGSFESLAEVIGAKASQSWGISLLSLDRAFDSNRMRSGDKDMFKILDPSDMIGRIHRVAPNITYEVVNADRDAPESVLDDWF
jgi:hypothetical protein